MLLSLKASIDLKSCKNQRISWHKGDYINFETVGELLLYTVFIIFNLYCEKKYFPKKLVLMLTETQSQL